MTLGHPFRDLSAFPKTSVPEHHWRVVRRGRGSSPAWFANTGRNRFDLHPDGARSTCYLADSAYGALLETVLRDAVPTGDHAQAPLIAPAEVTDLVLVEVDVPQVEVADLSGTGDPPPDLHGAFGVTEELGSCASYERPQQWAAALDVGDHGGIRYRSRHGNGLLGTARFGPLGDPGWHPTSAELDITGATVHEAHNPVVGPPAASALDWLPDDG